MVYGISDESIPRIKNFIKQTGITFPILHDTSGLAYGAFVKAVKGGQTPYPVDIIVGPNGLLQYGSGEYDRAAMVRTIQKLLPP